MPVRLIRVEINDKTKIMLVFRTFETNGNNFIQQINVA